MKTPGLMELIVSCPDCRRGNRVLSDRVAQHQVIRCSRCSTVLGTWQDLKAMASGQPTVPDGALLDVEAVIR